MNKLLQLLIQEKEKTWHYTPPNLKKPVEIVAIGVDGTCMLVYKDGYREAMVATISMIKMENVNTLFI